MAATRVLEIERLQSARQSCRPLQAAVWRGVTSARNLRHLDLPRPNGRRPIERKRDGRRRRGLAADGNIY